MYYTNNSGLIKPFGLNEINKIKWMTMILTGILLFTASSIIKPVWAETESETKWVLDHVNVGEGGELISPEGTRGEGSFSKWMVSESSIRFHDRALDHWGADDYTNAIFEFTLPVFPSELVPGQTVEISASGSGSGYMRGEYYVVSLEFWSDDVGLTGKLSSGEEVHGVYGPYLKIDIDSYNWVGDSWVLAPTDIPDSDTVTVKFEAPSCDWSQEFSVGVFLWNGMNASVEWVYRCEETGEVPEEDPEEIPETKEPTFKVEPEKGNPGSEVTCTGANYTENTDVTIFWDLMHTLSDSNPSSMYKWETTTDSNGAFKANITIPYHEEKGIHIVTAETESITLSDDVEVIYKPIIFIPGVGGSVLYQESGLIPGELWPVAYTAGRKNLILNTDGTSSHNISAPDIIRYILGYVDIYGSFVDTVISWGYEENKDFFVFPYDWRQDNYIHVEDLDKKIEKALSSTGQKKVVLVAHSMGGIVARAYMDKKSTKKIDSFITMGTPHRGSVKPYYAFLMGYNFGNDLAGHKLMKVILQNCPSGYQLIPWNTFIKDSDGRTWTLEESFAVHYHEVKWDPVNGYADAWNWEWFFNPEMLKNGKAFRNDLGTSAPPGIETYTIIGQGVATLSSFTAREPTFWESLGYTGIKKADGSRWVLEPDLKKDFGDGDGTVPLWSEEGLQNDKKFYIQNLPDNPAEHGKLPANTIVQALIKDIIMGEEGSVDDYPKVEFNDLEGQTGFEIHSSANLHIYDSKGNHMGVNEYGSIEEDIPGGSMIAMDGYEYCSILNPQDSYNIEVVGFEEGNFTLNVVITIDGETVEFSYPEIDVINGTIASFTLLDSQSTKDDPPEMIVQTEDVVLSFRPGVIEEQIPVEDTTTSTEDADNDSNSGIPGFPIWSIGLALLLFTLLHRKRIISKQF